MKRILLAVAIAAGAMPLHAADAHLYLGAGYDLGGDNLYTVTFTNGDNGHLKAGEGFSFTVGSDIDVRDNVMIRATLGYKMNTVVAENGDVTFRRIPLELTGYRFFGDNGIGGGLTYHTGARLTCDIDTLCDQSVDVDNATGMVLEYLYRSRREDTNKGFTVGVRAVFGLRYRPEEGGDSANGNSIGINLGVSL